MRVDTKQMVLWLLAFWTSDVSSLVGLSYGEVADFAVYMLLAMTFFWLFERWFSERLLEGQDSRKQQREAGDQ